MSNRTEILHFRATPEEKETIRENAGHAEVALSEWMRQRSLDRLNPVHEDFNEITDPDATEPAVEDDEARNARELARDAALYGTNFRDVTGKRIDPTTIKPSALSETYEQFMERRLFEMLGQEDASEDAIEEAEATISAEWAANEP